MNKLRIYESELNELTHNLYPDFIRQSLFGLK